VLLHLDNDVELHRLSHGPGDAVVWHPTTRRLVVVQRISQLDDPPLFRNPGEEKCRRRCSCTDPFVR
jgi:hypothetical protein